MDRHAQQAVGCRGARRGLLHICMSTISPVLSVELDAACRQHGIRYVAAPLFGRPDAAANARLQILVAGRFASPDVVLSPKSGFVFTLSPGVGGAASSNDCNAQATQTQYYMTGTPMAVSWGMARRSFSTSETATVWERPGTVAPTEPFGADGATPID